MAITPTKVNFGKGLVDGNDVPIVEATERWSEITLEDGTTIRVKPNVFGVVRIENQYDQDNNPLYAVKSATVMTIGSVPAHLKKNATGTGKAN